MMKLTGVLLLLGTLTIAFEAEERFAEAAAIAAAGEDISWRDARGYEECGEFRRKNEGHNSVDKPKSLEELCGESECQKYEELESTGCGFGIRRIVGAKWASTDIDISDIQNSIITEYTRLSKYISGDKIAHTVPVIIRWYIDSNIRNISITEATMHFYIPAEFQENTPVPTDKAVEIEEWEDNVVYYRTFEGNSMADEFGNLASALRNDDVHFNPYIAITAGFTSGYGRKRHGRKRHGRKRHDRHERHEVMFLE